MITIKIYELNPVMKNYIWGYEIWALAAHKDGDCEVINNNITLSQLLKPQALPVMIKIIKSNLPLSVQVHPDDDYAMRVEHDSGKTEMWHILDCEPDAFLYLGFNNNYTRDEIANAIKNNNLISKLNKIKVHKGDAFYIPAGTVHSIGGGILLAETQQNSNITYRVYDYNRLGADGKPRELHIAKALDVMNLNFNNNYKIPDSAKFKSQVLKLNSGDNLELDNKDFAFMSIILLSGEAELNLKTLTQYHAVLIINADADNKNNNLTLSSGKLDAEILVTYF